MPSYFMRWPAKWALGECLPGRGFGYPCVFGWWRLHKFRGQFNGGPPIRFTICSDSGSGSGTDLSVGRTRRAAAGKLAPRFEPLYSMFLTYLPARECAVVDGWWGLTALLSSASSLSFVAASSDPAGGGDRSPDRLRMVCRPDRGELRIHGLGVGKKCSRAPRWSLTRRKRRLRPRGSTCVWESLRSFCSDHLRGTAVAGKGLCEDLSLQAQKTCSDAVGRVKGLA